MGDAPEDPAAAKEYRSAVDEYYAAKARGENPNPSDYGLAPTPAEDMLKGLRYNTATGQYEDVAATRGGMAQGGVAGMFDIYVGSDGSPVDDIDDITPSSYEEANEQVKKPLREFLSFNYSIRSPASTIYNLFISKHCVLYGIPIHISFFSRN